jgi:hypothetical protein
MGRSMACSLEKIRAHSLGEEQEGDALVLLLVGVKKI